MRERDPQKAILVGAGESCYLDELGRLASTLGVEVVGRVRQNRRDGSGYLGRGKREALGELAEELGSGMVITDDELTASQARVLERQSGISVVDRTELIIRIFEVHAMDAASRLEVELADLQYRLPRVKGTNAALSRLGGGGASTTRGAGSGGAATRGPGEQQLEYDRRVIRERISVINRKLRDEKQARATRSARLRGDGPPTVALVGYTNAGKTTILNAISGAGRSTKDRLFETLETTTRLVEGRSDGSSFHPDFVVTDTVGFIRKLPPQLVRSFEGTMEAAKSSDVCVLCSDASSTELSDEIETVSRILGIDEEDNVPENNGESPYFLCLNKLDKLSTEETSKLSSEYPEAVMISATEDRVEPLLERVYKRISSGRDRMELLIPHSNYSDASRLYGIAEVHNTKASSTGLLVDVTLPGRLEKYYKRYKVKKGSIEVS